MAASITTKLTGNGKNNIIYFVNLKSSDLTDTIGCPVVSGTPGGAQNGPKCGKTIELKNGTWCKTAYNISCIV